jgi:hypothetical protein
VLFVGAEFLAVFAVWVWGQRHFRRYIAESRPDLLAKRQRIVTEQGLSAPLDGIGISISAHRALFEPGSNPQVELLRRRARIAVLVSYAWIFVSIFPVSAAYAVGVGVFDALSGRPFTHWDALYVLVYCLAIIQSVANYYRQAGVVSRQWWLARLIGLAGGLVFLIFYVRSQ